MRDMKGQQRHVVVRFCAAVILGGLLVPAVAAPATAASTACATAADEAALNTRVLQTELMVAALSCGEKDRYNAFVTTFRDQLSHGGQALRTMFRRVHGARGDYQMNAFVTKLANDAAQRNSQGKARYCASASSLFGEALATSPRDFDRLTAKPRLGGLHGFARCRS